MPRAHSPAIPGSAHSQSDRAKEAPVNGNGSGAKVRPARPGDPSRIGPYRIVGRLGAGGMGTVHAGVAPDGTRVAVKVIHPERAQEPEFRARFRREVELSSRVFGPCLVPLLSADPEAETPWLATTYVPGPTLNEYVDAHGPLTGGGLYSLASATAHALADIHVAGVVHRDVKPQNILLTPPGPRVLDFGIAHAVDGTSVTRTGAMTGTPGWISPEQYTGGTAGPEGDMFAWGALVAYAATGRLPFGTGSPHVVAFRVISEPPDLDGLPAPLRGIVERALAKEPGGRPTAAEAAQECAGLLATQATQLLNADAIPATTVDMIAAVWDVPVQDDPAWPVPARSGRSKGRLVGTVVLAAAVVGGLTGAVFALNPGGFGDESHTSASASASASSTSSPSSASSPASPGSGEPTASDSSGAPQDDPADGWKPDDAGLKQAMVPSSDSAEIEVADTAAKKIILQTNAMRQTLGTDRDLGNDEIKVGFDPGSSAMYVWSAYPTWGQQEADAWASMAAGEACRALMNRRESAGDAWPYSRYAVAEIGGSGYLMVRWGTATTRADCPA